MGNDWKVSKAQSPKEALDIRQPSLICPTQNLKQVLDFATAKTSRVRIPADVSIKIKR